jgi:hypothetical protein
MTVTRHTRPGTISIVDINMKVGHELLLPVAALSASLVSFLCSLQFLIVRCRLVLKTKEGNIHVG